MPWKNDLSAYKLSQKTALPNVPVATQVPVRSGRPAKTKQEKQSMTISLRFTPTEYAHIKDKAWLVQLGTYVKHLLATQTDLFE